MQERISGKRRQGRSIKNTRSSCAKIMPLDFDDLIVKTVELFQNNPQVLDYYQERLNISW